VPRVAPVASAVAAAGDATPHALGIVDAGLASEERGKPLGRSRLLSRRHFDVEELGTHGGSLRIYACHQKSQDQPAGSRVTELLTREEKAGVNRLDYYQGFGEKVKAIKRDLLEFLLQAKRQGKQIVGYGAPGKGNTLLNYCGIRTDFLNYTVDRNPYKHGKYTAGTHIPIFPPEKIQETKPDYVLILPWNLREEIVSQLSYIREWDGKCVVPIPDVEVL